MKKSANVNEVAKIKAFAKSGLKIKQISIKLNIDEKVVKSFIDYFVRTIKDFFYDDDDKKPVKKAKVKKNGGST